MAIICSCGGYVRFNEKYFNISDRSWCINLDLEGSSGNLTVEYVTLPIMQIVMIKVHKYENPVC